MSILQGFATRSGAADAAGGVQEQRKSRAAPLPVGGAARSWRTKRLVYGVEVGGSALDCDADHLALKGTVGDRIGEVEIEVNRQPDGGVSLRQRGAVRCWIAHRMFWFTWYTFHPDTLLRDGRR